MRRTDQADRLHDLFNLYIAAKENANLALSAVTAAEEALSEELKRRQQKSVRVVRDGQKFSATYTVRTTNVVDEKGLRKALSARIFDRYTVRKLDRKALEAAMSDGVVDPRVVAKYVEQVPGKSYLTYTVKEEDGTEGLQVG